MPDDVAKKPTPYRVAEDKPGCAECGCGKTWAVIGPGEVAESVSYDDEEDAQAEADALNEAYWHGQQGH